MPEVVQEWARLPLPLVLPELRVVPDPMHLFMFSAVTWNRHHVHYSRDAAVREGLPDIVVHRALLGNYLARMLTGWGGRSVHVRELSWKVLRSAYPGRPLRVKGVVMDREDLGGLVGLRCMLEIVDPESQGVVEGRALLVPRFAAAAAPAVAPAAPPRSA